MNEHITNPSQEIPTDVRVQLTRTIWICSTGMLGICIPLVGLSRSPVLPICVLGAAALGTVAVWMGRGSSTRQTNTSGSSVATQEQLRQLEERLANVETISRFERGLQEREAVSGPEINPAHFQEKERSAPRPSTPLSY